MAKLIVRYPNNVIKEVEFDQPRYRIGRAEDNDLILENEDVSPHQAEIETSNGAYLLKDVSENKSTAVNGKKVESVSITYGDRIAFGPVIGLFYPSKKGGMEDKTKLFLYLGAGAAIILLSIVLMFFFTSRKISSVVSQQMGEPFTVGETFKEFSEESRKALSTEKEGIQKLPGEQVQLSTEREKTEESFFKKKKPGISRPGKKKALILPEPAELSIRQRTAVAVPRGVRRVFFRKIPVSVEEEKPLSMLPEEGEGAGAPVREPEILEGGEGEELPEPEEQEKGILAKVVAPLKRLFKKEQPSFEEPEVEAVEEPEIEGGAPGRQPSKEAISAEPGPALEIKKPASKDIERIVNRLSAIKSRDIPEIRALSFQEEPVYSESELKKFKEESLFEIKTVSQSENSNIDILWKYPEGLKEKAPILRTGMAGKIDEDKSYDFLFGTKNNEIIALNGNTGEEIFRQNLGKPFFEPVLEDLNNDKAAEIIIAFEDGDIVIFTTNLEEIWSFKGEDKITALPLVLDVNGDKVSDIIFATLGMEIIALDGRTGFEIWRFFDAESEILFSPVGLRVNSDSVKDILFPTREGFLYALDGKTGWGLWKRDIFGKPAGPCVTGDLDGNGEYDIVTLTRNGILSAYRKNGKLLFTWETGSNYRVPPSIGDTDSDRENEIVLVDEDGMVRVIAGKTRREKWSFQSEEGTTLVPIALADINADGGLDVALSTVSGVLYVLDGETGALLGEFNSRGYNFTTPIIYDLNRDKIDEIVVCTYNGDVFAVQVAGTKRGFFSLKKSYWIAAHHDVNNTGFSARTIPFIIKNPWK